MRRARAASVSGTRRPGIRQVAARAGVGIATVSRVFTGKAEVNPELKERVIRAADELGYEPDITAQSLRRGATRSAGFVADDLGLHLNTEIATGAEGLLRARGYSLLVMNSEMEPTLDVANIRVLRARRVDALMMTPVTEDDPGLVTALESVDVPVVVIEGDLPGLEAANFVVSDHRVGAAAALRHLVRLGHRRLALIHGPRAVRSARQRALAVEEVARDDGPDVRIDAIETELTATGGERSMAALVAGSDPPSGVVVGGDQLLAGVLRALRTSGAHVGTDVSLVASDPVPLADVFDPPLARITRDSIGLGRVAAEIMLRAIADPEREPELVALPTTYTPNASVGPPRS